MQDLRLLIYSPEQEYPEHTILWIKVFGKEKIWKLPPWVLPGHKTCRTYNNIHTSKPAVYEELVSRAYGFWYSPANNFLQIKYGIQDEYTDLNNPQVYKNWCCSLPWNDWTHVRTTLHQPTGAFYADITHTSFEQEEALLVDIPKIYFQIKDFDGEIVQASAYIKERTWLKGRDRWSWLSRVCKPLVKRSLQIKYEAEVGSRKKSYKGGTLGYDIDLKPGESNLDAIVRACDEDRTFEKRKINLVPDTYHIGMKPDLLIQMLQWVLGLQTDLLPEDSLKQLIWRTNLKLLKQILPKELRPLSPSKANKTEWVMAFLNQNAEFRRGLLIKHPLLIYVLPSDLTTLNLDERPKSCGCKKLHLYEFPVYGVIDTVCYWHSQQFQIKTKSTPQFAAS